MPVEAAGVIAIPDLTSYTPLPWVRDGLALVHWPPGSTPSRAAGGSPTTCGTISADGVVESDVAVRVNLVTGGASANPHVSEADFRLSRFAEGAPLRSPHPYVGAGEMR
ncbi:hypothetical protein ACTXG6_09900 [Pseudonocardia sp. Cha107L01]|uniref:hypothetical protein n=1 Tax=Pseudonocardia sp. Cha107L01 TaxID=3457576 RepID=UPI00403E7350